MVYNFTVSAFLNILLLHSPKHSALWHLDGSCLLRAGTVRLWQRQEQFEVYPSKMRWWADLLGDHKPFVPRQLIQKIHELDWLPRCCKLWAECSDVAKTCELIRGVSRHAYLKSTTSSWVPFTFIIRRILRSFSHWYNAWTQKNERKIIMPMTNARQKVYISYLQRESPWKIVLRGQLKWPPTRKYREKIDEERWRLEILAQGMYTQKLTSCLRHAKYQSCSIWPSHLCWFYRLSYWLVI